MGPPAVIPLAVIPIELDDTDGHRSKGESGVPPLLRYCTLIASESSPPLDSLRLASARSVAVP